ncbi:C40 family peptidase [Hymenobacter nivis]|uniref:NlpC/P60 family protein n=1 Tax=Hymenobacter nivis TaxID=1850093 RepID=A0A502GRX2_9BACT|nr:C40 family peptidase [Hymenobacter nivis]TPG63673.1 NlpC/P60 family protein [Hymenobacter nivis]
MRIIWLIFIGLAAAIVGLAHRGAPARPAPSAPPAALVPVVAVPPTAGRADSVVAFALRQLGAPYRYAGTSPTTGFDCSGFVQFVYGRFGVAVPHSTALLIGAGREVPRATARPGDLVVFAGTAPGSTTAGHAGIVVSAAGAVPVRFVHASSARRESGVKVSAIEGTGYETRFLQVRRVL